MYIPLLMYHCFVYKIDMTSKAFSSQNLQFHSCSDHFLFTGLTLKSTEVVVMAAFEAHCFKDTAL